MINWIIFLLIVLFVVVVCFLILMVKRVVFIVVIWCWYDVVGISLFLRKFIYYFRKFWCDVRMDFVLEVFFRVVLGFVFFFFRGGLVLLLVVSWDFWFVKLVKFC